MKRLFDPKVLLAALSLGLVVLLALRDAAAPGPGPLHPVHAGITAAAGLAGCTACHGEGGDSASMTAACSTCHDEIAAQIAATKGLHGRMLAADGIELSHCARCHGEHLGGAITLVDDASFVRAGIPGLDAFGHRLLGFTLEGRHADLDCATCHTNAHIDLLAEGDFRFRGLRNDCVACHTDVHGQQFQGRPVDDVGCMRCHDAVAFAAPTFDAVQHAALGFVLDGAHGQIACSACHAAPDGSEVTTFRGTPRACSVCHEDTHRGAFASDTAAVECVQCHGTAAFAPLTSASFEHGLWTGFALEGAHARAACSTCHGAGASAARRLGRVGDVYPGDSARCDTCHDSPHGDRFASLTIAGEAAPDCATCHADPHDGAFSAATAQSDAFGCARCHEPLSFRSLQEFDHGGWTGWALNGAHADTNCAQCHQPQPEDALGRSSARARGSPCADCHADPHLGQFAAQSGGEGCVACHSASDSFESLLFDHDTARFALDATHASPACASCHRSATTTDGRSAVRYRPLGRECGDCHDPNGDGGATRARK